MTIKETQSTFRNVVIQSFILKLILFLKLIITNIHTI